MHGFNVFSFTRLEVIVKALYCAITVGATTTTNKNKCIRVIVIWLLFSMFVIAFFIHTKRRRTEKSRNNKKTDLFTHTNAFLCIKTLDKTCFRLYKIEEKNIVERRNNLLKRSMKCTKTINLRTKIQRIERKMTLVRDHFDFLFPFRILLLVLYFVGLGVQVE